MVPYTRNVATDADEKKLGAWVHCQRKNYHMWQKSVSTAQKVSASASDNNTNHEEKASGINHSEGQGNLTKSTASPAANSTEAGNSKNRMKPQRIAALDKLGFVWSFYDQKWELRIKDLMTYKSEHGHLNVPFKYPPNQSLAHWVHNQRRDYNLFQEGRPSQMTVEKLNELSRLGFVWKSDYPRTKRKVSNDHVLQSEEELWQENYRALVGFHADHGHCSVNRFTSVNRKLCAWLTWQRKQHKLFKEGRPSQMNQDRADKLTALGFEWIPKNKPGGGAVQSMSTFSPDRKSVV